MSADTTASDFAFETAYGCENCGNEWSDQHPARTTVKADTLGRVRAVDEDCSEIGGCDNYCHVVKCPVCKLEDHVRVADRSPLADEEADDE